MENLATGTYDVTFSDVRVPLDNIVGEREGLNKAWPMLVGPGLDIEKLEVSAMALGIASAAVDEAWTYAQERIQFGGPVSAFQSIRHMLADAKTKLHACRIVTYNAADSLDNGSDVSLETSMAKLFASEAAETIVSGAIQTLGGYGYLEEFGVAKIYRDVRVCQIYEGTSDIQRMVIARSL